MTMNESSLLFLRIPDLMLRSKLILKGFYSGIHQVPYKGFSAEFSQYREYVAGDDFERIDWKVFLRTQKLYLKESEDESNADILVFLDMSRSMGFSGKDEYGKTLAAVFAYIAHNQADSFGYGIFSDRMKFYRKPKRSKRAIFDLIKDLNDVNPSGKTDILNSMSSVIEKIRKSSFIIMISDCADNERNLIDTLASFKALKNDVILFHLGSREEEKRDILDNVALKDVETGEVIQKSSFQERINAIENWKIRIYESCIKSGIDYQYVYTDDSFNSSISLFFQRRKK